MTVTLPLELEQKVRREAARRGVSADQLILNAVEHTVLGEQAPAASAWEVQPELDEDQIRKLQLLDSFMMGDPEEQRVTLDSLRLALGDERASDRKLF